VNIVTYRDYKNHHTDGEVFIDGEHFCHSLEDIGRPHGVKIPGETCIPEAAYNVAITRSTRWHKDMMLLYNCDDGCIRLGDTEYSGIRPHGGNTIADTHGCPLVAYNSDGKGRIWDRASDRLLEIVRAVIDDSGSVIWEFRKA